MPEPTFPMSSDALIAPRAHRGGLILRALLTVVFLAAANMKFAAVPFEVAGFERFGYPLWFMFAVGTAQLAGAVMLWRNGLVSYGALLLAAIMVGAVASHLRAGDALPVALPAMVLLVLLVGVAYRWRHRAAWPGSCRTVGNA